MPINRRQRRRSLPRAMLRPIRSRSYCHRTGRARCAQCVRLLVGDADFESMDYRLKLYVVFCEPQVATVGFSENEAKANGMDYLAASYPFCDHGKSLIMDETDGFVKLLADKSTGEILALPRWVPMPRNWSMKSWSRCAFAPQPVNLPPSSLSSHTQ